MLQDQPEPSEIVELNFEMHQTDEVISQQLLADMLVTEKLNPHHPAKLKNTLIVIPGVSGDGSNGTPDYIDREHTTAFIDTENHTFG